MTGVPYAAKGEQRGEKVDAQLVHQPSNKEAKTTRTAKAQASKTSQKRSEATKAQPRTEDGHKLAEKQVSEQLVQIPEAAKDPTPTRTAKASKTNRGKRRSGNYLP